MKYVDGRKRATESVASLFSFLIFFYAFADNVVRS